MAEPGLLPIRRPFPGFSVPDLRFRLLDMSETGNPRQETGGENAQYLSIFGGTRHPGGHISLRNSVLKRLAGIPFGCRHAELSVIATLSDDISRPNDRLLDISLQAIQNARSIDLSDIKERAAGTIYESLDVWPGEHYKLLAGLVSALKPDVVVEIGTAKGAATLSMKKTLKKGAKIATFDVGPKEKVGLFFRESDFDGCLEQHLDDLTDHQVALKHAGLLKSADLIFVDALKDGKMEYKFLENFQKVGLKDGALLVFDDIKVWNMLRFWRELKYPKLDLTSFGHWSGTGIAQWALGKNF